MFFGLMPGIILLAASCGGVENSIEPVAAQVSSTPVNSQMAVSPMRSADTKDKQTAVFAGGCFWGVEAVFEHVKGVVTVTSGYSGGTAATANYEMVGTGKTGHAEAVKIIYDPSQVSYKQLLKIFFSAAHDPTELNRQGPDVGTHYRSAIFYSNEEQKRLAQDHIDELTRAKAFARPIVTQVAPLDACYQAERYHQDYMERHPDEPYIVIHDKPKLETLRKLFADLYLSK